MEVMDVSSSDQDRHWHLDKRINVGHIFTTLGLLAGLFTWGSSVETRIALLNQQGANQDMWMQQVTTELQTLNDKMQQLVELTAYQRGLNENGSRR